MVAKPSMSTLRKLSSTSRRLPPVTGLPRSSSPSTARLQATRAPPPGRELPGGARAPAVDVLPRPVRAGRIAVDRAVAGVVGDQAGAARRGDIAEQRERLHDVEPDARIAAPAVQRLVDRPVVADHVDVDPELGLDLAQRLAERRGVGAGVAEPHPVGDLVAGVSGAVAQLVVEEPQHLALD